MRIVQFTGFNSFIIKPVLGICILTNFNDFTEIVHRNENTNNGTNPYITAIATPKPFTQVKFFLQFL